MHVGSNIYFWPPHLSKTFESNEASNLSDRTKVILASLSVLRHLKLLPSFYINLMAHMIWPKSYGQYFIRQMKNSYICNINYVKMSCFVILHSQKLLCTNENDETRDQLIGQVMVPTIIIVKINILDVYQHLNYWNMNNLKKNQW